MLIPLSRSQFRLKSELLNLASPEFLQVGQGVGRIGEEVQARALVTQDHNSTIVDAVIDPVFGNAKARRELRNRQVPGDARRDQSREARSGSSRYHLRRDR